MFDIFTQIRYLLKLERVTIDNAVFLLHYKVTAISLAVLSIIVTSKQYFGDPIDCMSISDSRDKKTVNTFCWIYSTFTVDNQFGDRRSVYPGVAPDNAESHTVHQSYYQWICFILGFQSILFLCPHCLWRVWEGGKLKMLVSDLRNPTMENWTPLKKQNLIYYLTNKKIANHNFYLIKYLLCESLNLANIVLQVYFLNMIFNKQFMSYGVDVLEHSRLGNGTNPMDKVFPKITKCTFKYYGPTGSTQHIDSICILPLNIMNEKIFLILWFWFLVLFLLTGFGFLYDIFVVTNPSFRVYTLQARARFISRQVITRVVRKNSMGVWFLLQQIGKNVNPIVFGELLTDLAMIDRTKQNV